VVESILNQDNTFGTASYATIGEIVFRKPGVASEITDLEITGKLTIADYSLPQNDGLQGQALITNGGGVVSFQDIVMIGDGDVVTNRTWSSSKIAGELGIVDSNHLEIANGEISSTKTWSSSKINLELSNINSVATKQYGARRQIGIFGDFVTLQVTNNPIALAQGNLDTGTFLFSTQNSTGVTFNTGAFQMAVSQTGLYSIDFTASVFVESGVGGYNVKAGIYIGGVDQNISSYFTIRDNMQFIDTISMTGLAVITPGQSLTVAFQDTLNQLPYVKVALWNCSLRVIQV
jgi:hypothetical protein